ncbi:glycerophosphodiester phosphodiesterase [Weissella viridescens]|uniref:Glycerophosphodiester phosphodiesterase n=1 Tax=Weissella viridescens TaxID=1629 RepID=A0A3P2RAF0_WEIVI|nr:glycerophosphodiester phosphodiesterase family protein [Weissella viridescens]RRG17809.1 glycerophosphodiester phosphodiesterase [Weissella viridescens]
MDKTTIFGHRGIPTKFIENSIDGFEYLASKGEAVEFDVHLTKDFHPVVMHDEKIDRTTNGHGYIRDFTLAELAQFHLISDNQRPQQRQGKQNEIPTLERVLEIFKSTDLILNIELKTENIQYPGIESIALEAVHDFGLAGQTVFSSVNLGSVKRIGKLDEHQQIALISEEPILRPLDFMARNQLDALHLKKSVMANDFPQFQRIWTIDDTATLKHIFEHGFEGVFTDDFESADALRTKLMTRNVSAI